MLPAQFKKLQVQQYNCISKVFEMNSEQSSQQQVIFSSHSMFHNGKKKWLQQYAQSIGANQSQLLKHAQIFNKQFQLIPNSKTKFQKQRKKHYFCMTIQISKETNSKIQNSGSQQSQIMQLLISAKQKAECESLFFKIHRQMIRYLSKNKYRLGCIAEHNFLEEQKNQSQTYFRFEIERGIQYDQPISNKQAAKLYDTEFWKNVTNPIILFVFARDLAKAISELQKHQIYHSDIEFRNIVLFYCEGGLKCFEDKQKLRDAINQIRFKLIDFGDAYLMSKNNSNKTKLNKYCSELFFDASRNPKKYDFDFSELQDQSQKSKDNKKQGNQLSNQGIQPSQSELPKYKKNHSDSFHSLIERIKHNVNTKGSLINSKEGIVYIDKFEEEAQQILALIKSRNYKKLTQLMGQKIDQYLNVK